MKIVLSLFCVMVLLKLACSEKKAKPIKEQKQSQKYSNPDFVRDRFKTIIVKPDMPSSWIDQYRLPFHPAWMDYCDPYHCNDYHKIACGLNRQNMKFKWFQSTCHIIINNQCANYRGALRYDWIEDKYCTAYVMFARSRACPAICDEESQLNMPVCGQSAIDKHVVLFENECALAKANCQLESLQEYEVMDTELCLAYALNLPNSLKTLRSRVCPPTCSMKEKRNACGRRHKTGKYRRFKNECAFERVNCDPKFKENYVEASMVLCILAEIIGIME